MKDGLEENGCLGQVPSGQDLGVGSEKAESRSRQIRPGAKFWASLDFFLQTWDQI
jgi:hypothetical protein